MRCSHIDATWSIFDLLLGILFMTTCLSLYSHPVTAQWLTLTRPTYCINVRPQYVPAKQTNHWNLGRNKIINSVDPTYSSLWRLCINTKPISGIGNLIEMLKRSYIMWIYILVRWNVWLMGFTGINRSQYDKMNSLMNRIFLGLGFGFLPFIS